jgi:outer membrane protein insertion porin family
VTVPVGDLRYGKLGYQYQHWFPIGSDYALMLNADVGYAKGFGGKDVPFYKNYYVGGIGSVRGFDQGSVGPKFMDTDGDITSTGGTRKVVANAEFFFPMPGAGKDRSFRISAFFDAGYVWGEDEQPLGSGSFVEQDVRFRRPALQYRPGVLLELADRTR